MSPVSLQNRILRRLWFIVSASLFRFSPVIAFGWRNFLLSVFGAELGRKVRVYPSAHVWAPWALQMGDRSCLAGHVLCYNVGRIVIGSDVTVSQYSYLCAATHDYNSPKFTLVVKPITICDRAWIAADAFIGPGVNVGEGAVVLARAVVVRDVMPWRVVAGNPASVVRDRKLV